MQKFFLILIMSLILWPPLVSGKERDSLNRKRSGFIPLPILMYSPETRIGAGVALSYYFRARQKDRTGRPSLIMPSFIYTQEKQIICDIYTALYWKEDRYYLSGYLGYKKFPDKFYGIGNNTSVSAEESYTPQIFRLAFSLQRKISNGFHAGIQYEFERNGIIQKENDGLLAAGNIPGSAGGYLYGIGFMLRWDTRQNIFYPTSGKYYQLYVGFFSGAIGSDYDYQRYTLDLRRYFSLFSSSVLALQGYMNITSGRPPFQKLSQLAGRIDGQNLMRGYYEGRYRDKNMFVFRMEYRLMPLWGRFGAVVFAGWGDVADKIDNFEWQNVKYSVGAGIRFLIVPEERLNIRFDLAYGNQSNGMYITIGEAL